MVEHLATRRTRLRTRRSAELVAAPGDLEHRAIKFVMLKFPSVFGFFVYECAMHSVTKYRHDLVNEISIPPWIFHFHFSNY